jgi:hypothetical protein
MKAAASLLAGLLLGGSRQNGPPPGLAVERTVKVTFLDWLGVRRDVQRKESVRIKGANVSVTDRTFGERLILRSDLKKVWKADPLRGEYSEYTFEEVAAIRKAALDEVRAAQARVPGTPDERELATILEGFDQFREPPKVALAASGTRRELTVNDDRVRLAVEVDPALRAGAGYFEALAAVGAFPPAVAEKLRDLGGFPVKGTVRYVLFLERVVEQFEVTSAKEQDVPDAEFELPAGLKKVPLRGFGPAPERRPAKPGPVRRDFKEDDVDRPQDKKGKP